MTDFFSTYPTGGIGDKYEVFYCGTQVLRVKFTKILFSIYPIGDLGDK